MLLFLTVAVMAILAATTILVASVLTLQNMVIVAQNNMSNSHGNNGSCSCGNYGGSNIISNTAYDNRGRASRGKDNDGRNACNFDGCIGGSNFNSDHMLKARALSGTRQVMVKNNWVNVGERLGKCRARLSRYRVMVR